MSKPEQDNRSLTELLRWSIRLVEVKKQQKKKEKK
jgi:hypothetical protein